MTESRVASDADVLHDYIARCSNWGRWGDDDERGAINFIGPDQIRNAAALVRRGTSLSLTLPYDARGPQSGAFRSNPQVLTTATGLDYLAGEQDPLPAGWGAAKGFGYADDLLVMHTQAGTQWDALSHIFWEGKMWNGRSAGEVTSQGSKANGIENYTARIVTRGILVDLPVLRGVDSLEPGYAISVNDIEECLAAHSLEIRTGDALIVRTGFMAARRGNWGDYAGGSAPGLSLHTASWLHEKEIAAVATDTWGVEVRPNEIDYFQPLHIVALVHTGVAFGEMFDLDALAADCANDGVYEFMFVASPLPLTGGTGSPVSAVALK
ncbi:cyclase family protein [Rhodococcus sp. IEGM 1351]|uniref:cyclase family protein n=1 Tax=Rhodococcus sp. IEGM 1351 TaxID=3047089 RepID=UPI0024B71CF3|nr:cyclase family protein [Rhodococcus sp. IEGM 1351]MDI9939208.1 cyclase family protein [Rhodococcus sp. IEGM 1351]